jgi:hypothetical protein
VFEARSIQPRRGCHHVGPGFGVRDGYTRQHVQGLIIEHIAFGQVRARPRAVGAVEQAAMPVISVFAQTHVGNHQHLGHRGLDGLDGLLYDAVGRKVLQTNAVLFRRQPKQQHGRDAQRRRGLGRAA